MSNLGVLLVYLWSVVIPIGALVFLSTCIHCVLGERGDLCAGGQRHEAGGPGGPPGRPQTDVHREAEDDGPAQHHCIDQPERRHRFIL